MVEHRCVFIKLYHQVNHYKRLSVCSQECPRAASTSAWNDTLIDPIPHPHFPQGQVDMVKIWTLTFKPLYQTGQLVRVIIEFLTFTLTDRMHWSMLLTFIAETARPATCLPHTHTQCKCFIWIIKLCCNYTRFKNLDAWYSLFDIQSCCKNVNPINSLFVSTTKVGECRWY